MKQIHQKPVSRERVEELLDCYGASSNAWPEQERQAALSRINSDPALQQYRDEVAQLDRLIEADREMAKRKVDTQPLDALAQKILSALPEQATGQVKTKLAAQRHRPWFGAIAASILVAAIAVAVLMNTQHTATTPIKQAASSEFDQYANWEVFGDEMPADDTDPVIFPLIALVEPDLL